MMRYAIFYLLFATSLFNQSAIAQVFKCAGAGGKVVYSDKPCEQNTTGGMLLRERTLEEKIQEREQAYDAEMRKQERRTAEQERELIQQYQNEMADRRLMQEQKNQPRHKDYEERLRERNASVRSRYEQPQTRAQRGLPPVENNMPMHNQTPPQNPAPSHITNCAGGFCHDNMGGVYHQHGPNATTMTGPNGSTCIRTGITIQCH